MQSDIYERRIFYNRQLMDSCGFVSESTFIRSRQKLIDAGLLAYEEGAKRRAGYYFVTGFSFNLKEKAEGKR